ncbi:ergosteryl-beta-glucosidase [Trichomonascus vanleenenianus]|uniref:ergosteryl-beta-glucosidase n=1 Tax=Trichomonascus vanleenenianus TaxID=2268995 RepID=UPI003ECB945A
MTKIERLPKLVIEKGNFSDEYGRVVTLRGINVAGDAKYPSKPLSPTPVSLEDEEFWNGDQVSYVGSPFPLEDADAHFQRLKDLGFNVVRYLVTWEAIEHGGPGVYDDDFITFTIEMLMKLRSYGMYAFIDPHQDVWSRYCGGDGAPLWTLYAAGLDPKAFEATQAALLHGPTPKEDYLDMIWASNYDRFACLTMFTLFFAGEDFAPKCIINGVNIQSYLQSHFLDTFEYLATRIYEADLGDVVIGFESMNEPGHGFIGNVDITVHPPVQMVKLGPTPTPFEAILLGSGIAVDVDYYIFTQIGPKKKQNKFAVDPNGARVWLDSRQRNEIDIKYCWERDPAWVAGKCIWALHGVWDDSSQRLLRPDFFAFDKTGKPFSGNGERAFVDNYFVDHWKAFTRKMRSVSPDCILFLQPPVNLAPPPLKDTDLIDANTAYSPHYYDGLTLMLKKWNRYFNVDAVGVLRGKYLTPLFGMRLGEKSIRSSIASQLQYIKKEGRSRLGSIPCLVSEIGVPFDMSDKEAYRTGDYSEQLRAMDALNSGLEEATLSYTLWNYTASNSYKNGDNWNGEDLSIYSSDFKEHNGIRVLDTLTRPFALRVAAEGVSVGVFQLRKGCYTLKLHKANDLTESKETAKPTQVFIPRVRFPENEFGVFTSSGTWDYDKDSQTLSWWHSHGSQILELRGTVNVKSDFMDTACVIA